MCKGFPHPSSVSLVSDADGRALQESLVQFELAGFGRGSNAVFQGNHYGLAVFAVKPIVCLHRRLWTNRVRVQVLLEEVRLKDRDMFSPHGMQTEHLVEVYRCHGNINVQGMLPTLRGTVMTTGSHFLSWSL